MSLPSTGDALYDAQLEALGRYFRKRGLAELVVNTPGEVGLLIRSEGPEGPSESWVWEAAPSLDRSYLESLCHTLANKVGQRFDPVEQPRVSVQLPGGHRFEAMVGKVVTSGLSVTIRVKRRAKASLGDFGLGPEVVERLAAAMAEGANVVVSGGTATGKTTFLNLLLELIPADKRLFIMEDTVELEVPHRNVTRRVLARNETGVAIGYPEVFDHAMRSRPDQVLLGELSTTNAFAAISLLNTGHRGFAATLHADSPRLALGEKFYQYLALAGHAGIPADYVARYLEQVVDLVIQIRRDHGGSARRRVTEIWAPAAGETWELGGRTAA